MGVLKKVIETLVPRFILKRALTVYHMVLISMSALFSGFPARRMTIIGVTGTKGKSTVADMMHAVLLEAGYTTALASTIRFAIGKDSKPNLFKMTMAGRGFLQRFLRSAKNVDATHAVIEVTSEGSRQFRHWFLFPNALIVTNVEREHIESHGSFEKYVEAKRNIVSSIEHSSKPNRLLVLNGDNETTRSFNTAQAPALLFEQKELSSLGSDDHSVWFTYKNISFNIPIAGKFNAMNALSVIKVSEHLGIPLDVVARALHHLPVVKGRVEHINAGQNFSVIVDYAHTPDSLKALYGAFEGKRKICVLGNTGGGRDMWKRSEMGAIADSMCDTVILTNEDPYDESPQKIVHMMADGMKREPQIIMDRREAIREAIQLAQRGDVVLITGKGTDPFIMGAKGTKTPWSDASVAKEELSRLRNVVV